MSSIKLTGLFLGLLLFSTVLLLPPPDGLSADGWKTIGVAMLMATFWVFEPIPIPATSLLPLIIFPLLDVADLKTVAVPYSHPVIMLLLGGFIIATSLEKWNLHRRVAMWILLRVGHNLSHVVAGFMFVTALLSMWISNTASTLMIMPIALTVGRAVLGGEAGRHPFLVCLVIGVAYGANIGGIATLIGTPSNVIAAGYLSEAYGQTVTFLQWAMFGVPVALLLLPAGWLVLTKITFRFDVKETSVVSSIIYDEMTALGKVTTSEKRLVVIFLMIAGCWILRPLLSEILGLPNLNDTVIALSGVLVLFLVPSGNTSGGNAGAILDWETARKIPWGMLILFGGGLSLAAIVADTGVSDWLSSQLRGTGQISLVLLMALVVGSIVFLTEFTSNVGTITAALPVLGPVAEASGADPLFFAVAGAVASSCAFMMPVATAPNAIAFSTQMFSIPEMMRAGLILNIIATIVITAVIYVAAVCW
ncbi:SLC13 family permease [Emcibacter nanhaiensis]|uniref:DASS family sodium-coupled anion symporter n=1 Tax=Emcibacter nanhaiensis TaxID=1505037 RepID=A0A501PJ23_9PROT|nr:DASS family sodium-coupled anion symporter [Emcibacter nanhaiensis]TPD60012.1 DASS family sodium-coupled anion symporter [Emcibacter nanhaiensis]